MRFVLFRVTPAENAAAVTGTPPSFFKCPIIRNIIIIVVSIDRLILEDVVTIKRLLAHSQVVPNPTPYPTAGV